MILVRGRVRPVGLPTRGGGMTCARMLACKAVGDHARSSVPGRGAGRQDGGVQTFGAEPIRATCRIHTVPVALHEDDFAPGFVADHQPMQFGVPGLRLRMTMPEQRKGQAQRDKD